MTFNHGNQWRTVKGNAKYPAQNLVAALVLCCFSALLSAQFKCPDSLLYTFRATPTQSSIVYWNPFSDYYAPGTFTNTSVSDNGIITFPRGLTLSPSLNGGTVSPTFYTTQFGTLFRWDGTAWVTTGVLISNSDIIDLAGCGNAMYAMVSLANNVIEVKKYTPPATVVSLFTVTGVAGQIVSDCSCNFYLLSKDGLLKYDAGGLLLKKFAYSGNPFSPTINGRFGIIGTTLYYISPGLPNNFPILFKGKAVISGDSLYTSTLSSLSANSGGLQFANCPVSSVDDPGVTLSTGSIGCMPPHATIVATSSHTSLHYNWSGAGLVPPAGTGPTVAVNQPGDYTVAVTEGWCDPVLQTLTTQVVSNTTVVSPDIQSATGFCHHPGMKLFTSVTGAGYSYLWTGPQVIGNAAGATITPGAPGIYKLTVTHDASGCSGSQITTIQSPLDMSFILNSPTMCVHSAIGQNSIVVTLNGSPNYTIVTPAGFSAAVQPGQPLALYHVPPFITTGTVETATLIGSNGGCTASVTASFSLLPVSEISAVPGSADVCSGGTLQLAAVGTPSCVWRPPANIISSFGSIATVKVTGSTVFTVTGIDQYGCGTLPKTIEVNVHPQVKGRLRSDGNLCAPACCTFVFRADEPAEFTASWVVSGRPVAGTDQFRVCFSEAGKFPVYGVLTDSLYGCRNFFHDTIFVYQKPQAELDWDPEEPVENVDLVSFTGKDARSESLNVKWVLTDGRAMVKHTGPGLTQVYPTAGEFPVAITVSNEWGCTDTLVKVITVKEDFLFYMPNSFTPNADERNDRLGPVHRGVRSMEFSVFDRWGERLFSTNDPDERWSGDFMGQPCQEGMYAWKVRVSTSLGEVRVMTGHVLLMR